MRRMNTYRTAFFMTGVKPACQPSYRTFPTDCASLQAGAATALIMIVLCTTLTYPQANCPELWKSACRACRLTLHPDALLCTSSLSL